MPFIIIGAFALLMAAAILAASYAVYRKAFYSDHRKKRDPYYGIDKGCYAPYAERSRELIDGIISMPYEPVETTSYDGLCLRGRYYHVKDGAPLEIQFHGYKSTPLRDFAGSGRECVKRQYNLLLIDQRAHGESEGRVISFGINERRDCLSWIDYALRRFGTEVEIILYGISMGGATVLMAAGEELPPNVRGVVADCPYSSPADIIKKVGKDVGIPPWLADPFIKLGARLFGGFSLSECSAEEAVRRAKVPILLIHGEGDDFVPCEMSRKIFSANGNIIFETFPGAGHGLSYFVDTERYLRVADGFVDSVLGEQGGCRNDPDGETAK